MPQLQQFRLPDVGEGLTEADILRWDVAVGDTVTVNQVLVEVETAKAAVELPSPYAGVVQALHVEEGQTVEVGTAIITIDTGGGVTGPVPGDDITVQAAAGAGARVTAAGEGGKREPNLVGYGPGHRGSRRRVPSAQQAFEAPRAAPAPTPASEVAAPEVAVAESAVAEPAAGAVTVLAKPPVRLLAKSLGVDLTTVTPSGPHGSVTRADVEAAVATPRPAAAAAVPGGLREERIPVRGVRKHTAAAMVASAFTAPHVTEFVTVDISATMELRDRVAARREFRDVKLSPLVFFARALVLAVPRTPGVNASWEQDGSGQATIVRKSYVNLGIAAATDRGLVVPNIREAQSLSLLGLAGAITDLATVARAGKTAPASLSGGTITITNIGVFGIDAGTPILNPGEAAILAVGAVRRAPWVVVRDGVESIEPRWVTQLALSFDHRLVDGAEGSQFLADIAAMLADPGLALL